MKPLHIPLITAIISLFISCNKDVTPAPTIQESCDTILPSNYLMTYPGSWWEYSSSGSVNNFTRTCDIWESLPVYLPSNSGECIFNEDILILPEGPIYTFDFILGDKEVSTDTVNYSTQIIPILDTVPGVFYEDHGGYSENTTSYSYDHYRKSFGFVDSIEVNGSVIHNVLHIYHHTSHLYDNSSQNYTYTHYYFVENIGLVKMNGYESFGPFTWELTNYYIAPH